MNNKRNRFALVAFLVIEVSILSGFANPKEKKAEQIALTYWYSATEPGFNLNKEGFRIAGTLSLSAIDQVEVIVKKNPKIFQTLNALVASPDKHLSDGAKLALSELSLIAEISQADMTLLSDTAAETFYGEPSALNAHYFGAFNNLSMDKDFQTSMKNAELEDRKYFQDALSKSEIRQMILKNPVYPILSSEATDEQIEVRKLAYSSHVSKSSYHDWQLRVVSLTQEQLSYGFSLADQSDVGIKMNIFQAAGRFGEANKMNAALVEEIVAAAKRHTKDPNKWVREALTRALRATGTEESKKLLFSMLDDPDFDVRIGAYYGLKNMGIEDIPDIKSSEETQTVPPPVGDLYQKYTPKSLSGTPTPEPTFAKPPPIPEKKTAKIEVAEPAPNNPFPCWIFIIGGAVVVGLVVVLKRK